VFQIHEYSSPFRIYHVVVEETESQIPGQRRVRSGPRFKTTNSNKRISFSLEGMSHNTDFPYPHRSTSDKFNVDILVYLAWCYLRHSTINFTTPEGGMDLIDILAKFHACFPTNRIGVGRWLLSGRHMPFFLRILEYLLIYFSQMGEYGTPEASRNRAGL